MLQFITENIATIIISVLLLAVVFFIVRKLVRDKKNGKSAGCGCSCSGCSGSSECHK